MIQVLPLDKSHNVIQFDCGVEALNQFLNRFALPSHLGGASRTYIALKGEKIIGYYTVAPGSVSPEEVTERVVRGLGKYPVPVILLARLAVDRGEMGNGYGQALLKDAVLRCYRAAESIGGRAVLVHAKDDHAKRFYQRFGFEPSPIDGFHLFLMMKDIKRNFS
jgi:GNAT superfamily N-acetyltransferase